MESKAKKVNLNFKVDEDIKMILNQLVVLKTASENSKSSQREVIEEALYDLYIKYTKNFNK